MNDNRTMGAPEASAAALGAGAAPKPSGKPQAPPSLPHAPREHAFDVGLWDEARAAFGEYLPKGIPFSVEILPFLEPFTDREGMKIRVQGNGRKYLAIGNLAGLRRALRNPGGLFTPEGCVCMEFWDAEPAAPLLRDDIPPIWISTVNEEVGSVVRAYPESGPPSTASLSRTCPNCRTVTRIPTMNDRCGYCPEHPRLIGGIQ